MPEIQPAELHYQEPLAEPVELERTKAKALILHSSVPGAQAETESLINEICKPNEYDRIAVPELSQNIKDGGIVMDWANVLEGKHRFEEVHVIEPKNRYQKAASTVLKAAFPAMKINLHPVKVEDDTPAKVLVKHCADLRFQTNFMRVVQELGIGWYEHFAVAGGSLATRNAVVVKMVEDAFRRNEIEHVVMMNHTDCAITGGLSRHHYSEHSEALKHAASLEEATKTIKSLGSGNPLKVTQHIIGIDGKLRVNQLQSELRLQGVMA
jgi:hypothetical protein